ncbi:MAG: hypothetical protein CL607_19435 [Anaerolineaceae bacterium]|nr:hypothetical protein [Anaerolineaceae bacterium]
MVVCDMLNKIYWEIPGRVIVTEYAGAVSVDDLRDGGETMVQLMTIKGQEPFVHAIIDTSRRANTDDHSLIEESTIAVVQQALLSYPAAGWTVIIDPTSGRLNRWMRTLTGQARQARYHICNSLDDALAFLNKQDTTLAN